MYNRCKAQHEGFHPHVLKVFVQKKTKFAAFLVPQLRVFYTLCVRRCCGTSVDPMAGFWHLL